MRARLLVIAAFVCASAMPGLIAYGTGMLPSAGRSPDNSPTSAGPEFRVTSLGWPDKALGLASTRQLVVWEQRSGDRAASGLWAFEVPTRHAFRLLGRADLGRSSGFPTVDGATIAWATRPAGDDAGPLQIRAFNSDTRRLFTVSPHGADPQGAGSTIVWIDTSSAHGARRTTVAGRNTVTDERMAIAAGGVVREVAAWRQLVAWTTGPRATASVWAVDRRRQTRYQLSSSGTGLTVDRRRVVWASGVGENESAIFMWDQLTRRSEELCRVPAHARSLDLQGDLVVWAQDSGGGDIWACDLNLRRAFPVCSDGAEQTRPVLAGGTVFWADRRSGHWELYGRVLQQ
jgi:hypothetical protein